VTALFALQSLGGGRKLAAEAEEPEEGLYKLNIQL
jgi:hypothetical protein